MINTSSILPTFGIILTFLSHLVPSIVGRNIQFTNKCGYDIWISPLTNAQGPPLPGGIPKLGSGASFTYSIPDGGWGGRFWPKSQCDSSGQSCQVGQSIPPCPPTGCQPPAETKMEFLFPPLSQSGSAIWYDLSLVDGYSLAVEIVPSVQQGSCVTTRCALSLDHCPTNENDVGDLRVFKNGQAVMCLSPCKKWNFPAPYGLGKSEKMDPGLHYCCPTPPVSPQECQRGIVTKSQYVNLVHRDCPTAYSYAYDDEVGLHNCPNKQDTNFQITICP